MLDWYLQPNSKRPLSVKQLRGKMRAIAAFQANLNAAPFDQYSHAHFAHTSVSIEHVFMHASDFETSLPSTSSSLIVPEL